jgi:hypothetical protein
MVQLTTAQRIEQTIRKYIQACNDADSQPRIVRGVDWFVFEPHTLCIQEIRPYAAAPIDPDKPRQELLDFDYVERGYPTTFPAKN